MGHPIDPDVQERRARIIQRRAVGIPPSIIAKEFGISEALVRQDIHRELAKRKAELDEHRDLLIAQQVEELEAVRLAAWKNASRRHYHVAQSGAVARDPDTGEPLIDTAPIDRALALVIKAQERMARLLALDAAQKVEVRAQVVNLDAFDAAIRDAQAELESRRVSGGLAGAPRALGEPPEGIGPAGGQLLPRELPA